MRTFLNELFNIHYNAKEKRNMSNPAYEDEVLSALLDDLEDYQLTATAIVETKPKEVSVELTDADLDELDGLDDEPVIESIKAQPEKVKAVESEPAHPIDDIDVMMASLDDELGINSVTKQEIETASNEVALDEVFKQPEPKKAPEPHSVSSLSELEAELGIELGDEVLKEPLPALKVEFQEAVKVESEPALEVEPEQAVVAEPRQIKISALEPDNEPMDEKAYKKASKSESELKYKPDLKAFQSEILVTDANMDKAIREHAGLLAYYIALHAESEAQAKTVKMEFEQLEAGLYDAHRRYSLSLGEKATEKAIENNVRMDKKWKRARKKVIDAEQYADVYRGFVNAIRDRGYMLNTLGANRREEMKGQRRILQEQDENFGGNYRSFDESQTQQKADEKLFDDIVPSVQPTGKLTTAQKIALRSQGKLDSTGWV